MTDSLYAYDLVWGEDWGHYYDRQSGYDYASPEEALSAARAELEKARREGAVDGPAGVYVVAMDIGETGDPDGWHWAEGPGSGLLASHSGNAEDIVVSEA